MAAAIVVQDHGDALPLGLFNEGRALYARASALCFALTLAGAAALGVELVRKRPLRVAGWVRGALVAFWIVEALLWAVDVTLVSRGTHARLGGPYRELRTDAGEWLTLKKAHAGSPYGFRSDVPYAREPGDGIRILFLGDSYTEGSGRGPRCNYPEVAAAALSEAWGRPVEAMNAGVAGYGPEDARRLLDHLVAEGFRFDAIVYGLFLENDFSDNLPGTDRRAVAGINYRYPEAAWLRFFHPLNARSFRYALFLQRATALAQFGGAGARRARGPCELDGAPPAEPEPGLVALAERRLISNYGSSPVVAEASVRRALDAMRARANELGVSFALVVFPDRMRVDRTLLERADPERRYRDTASLDAAWQAQPEPRIDVTPALDGAADYRVEDTHLSDRGNRRVGLWVAEALAGRWALGK